MLVQVFLERWMWYRRHKWPPCWRHRSDGPPTIRVHFRWTLWQMWRPYERCRLTYEPVLWISTMEFVCSIWHSIQTPSCVSIMFTFSFIEAFLAPFALFCSVSASSYTDSPDGTRDAFFFLSFWFMAAVDLADAVDLTDVRDSSDSGAVSIGSIGSCFILIAAGTRATCLDLVDRVGWLPATASVAFLLAVDGLGSFLLFGGAGTATGGGIMAPSSSDISSIFTSVCRISMDSSAFENKFRIRKNNLEKRTRE